jgi:diphosphomevalonate decarboxylase
MEALRTGEWQQAYEICWAEFWDMHALFETSEPHFSYMQPESLIVLRRLEQMWHEEKDGPLVTMDAGANVHLLWRHDQKNKALQIKEELKSKYTVFSAKELRV